MGKTIIVTAGPTNERIDAVMQITNMATGSLGRIVADKLAANPDVDRVYYISPLLAHKPEPDPKIVHIEITTAQDLLLTLECLLKNPAEHIDAVVHSAAVGDYKGRYAARAEDIAQEIYDRQMDEGYRLNYEEILQILTYPKCVQDSSTKISSYEPNLMVMLDLTPKVIGCVKQASPNTLLIGFKLLENVGKNNLFDVAADLLKKNRADYIVANDLAKMTPDCHPAMILKNDPNAIRGARVVKNCETKDEIAAAITDIILRGGVRN